LVPKDVLGSSRFGSIYRADESTRTPLPEGRQAQPLISAALPFAHSASGS